VQVPVVVRLYERADLAGVISLCQKEGWTSFPADPDRAHRAMTAPGVTTVVAFGDEAEANVVGFACLQSDGEVQAHLSLLEAVARNAAAKGCRRLWLITTNDNVDALRFYQRRGLRLVAVHRGAVDRARLVKPQIPDVGSFGIAVHDEIELELELPPA